MRKNASRDRQSTKCIMLTNAVSSGDRDDLAIQPQRTGAFKDKDQFVLVLMTVRGCARCISRCHT